MGSLIPPELSLDSRFSSKPHVHKNIGFDDFSNCSYCNNEGGVSSVQEIKCGTGFGRIIPLKKSCTDEKDDKIMEEEINRPAMDNLFQSSKSRTVLRAFVPFKGCTNFPVMTVGKEDRDELPVPGLSLCTPEIKNSREEISCIGFGPKFSSSGSLSSPATNVEANLKAAQQQSARKQRRCWSPELHRRFVNALQQLGGAQAATPKQIRELMQVDGLTNDEVKSHLQKYRLHTRRVTTKASTSQPVGLWMSQEQCGESLKHSNSQSASPEGPLQLAGSCHGVDSIEEEDD
ncbi:UNVERIFIED_CONTAM: Transcription factor HHO6 [Sesamum calycinum]|uniref:Transcription factor HHO6 n=1 Tax=Sesamum calycinum TaxID=2727403 RepID=A0AAW2PM10_9LAMI